MRLVVVIEGDDRVLGQVLLPGGEVLADSVLAVVTVDEQQADLGAVPLLADLHGEALDHGDVLGQTHLPDLALRVLADARVGEVQTAPAPPGSGAVSGQVVRVEDRKSTRLNSSHVRISYAVFCLKKKKKNKINSMNR